MTFTARTAGLAGIAGSLIGMVGAGTLHLMDPRVAGEYVSAPLTAGPFRLTELLWTLSHVLVLVAALGFVRGGFSGTSRGVRLAGWAALTGFALQVGAEFAFVFFAESKESDTGPVVLSTVFGVSSILIALGLIGLGIGTMKARRWDGWRRYAPLAWGIWSIAFIPLTFGDLFFIGIVSWLAVGLALWVAMLSQPATVPASPAVQAA
ncbi:hypothetical protein [Pseudonocardia sp.]|jgi:hypothetical protein|uniref:hypothetical protein n=1 Tax=Pseudonocardia sp. TaxID=60912 RepID=UPI0031FD7179